MRYVVWAVVTAALVGCGAGSGGKSDGQPKLVGPPDPKLQGPANPGGPAPAAKSVGKPAVTQQ